MTELTLENTATWSTRRPGATGRTRTSLSGSTRSTSCWAGIRHADRGEGGADRRREDRYLPRPRRAGGPDAYGAGGHRGRAGASHPDVRDRQPRLHRNVARRLAFRGDPAVVSDLYKPHELSYFIDDTACRYLFIDAEQVGKLARNRGQAARVAPTIIVRGPADIGAIAGKTKRHVVPFAGLAATATPAPPAHTRHSNDITYMFYSGGTTGTARASRISPTTSSWCPAAWQAVGILRRRRGVRNVEEILHARRVAGPLHPAAVGSHIVIVRDPPRPDVVLEALAEYKVTSG